MVWLVMRPTTTSGRAVWYSGDDSTTAGLRLIPVTPGKSTTTTSRGLGNLLILRIERGCIVQREGSQIGLILCAPRIAGHYHRDIGLRQLVKDQRRQSESFSGR